MESLNLSFQAVMPIFLLMLLGYLLKSIKVVDKKCFDGMNKLVFKVFLPTLLFYNIYNTQNSEVFNSKLVVFTIIGVMAVFVVGYASVFFLTKDNSRRGVMLQGFFRSNYAILGIPLVNYVCGENASGLVSLMVAVVVPLFNILAVVSLERFRDGKLNVAKLFKGVITNPLIIACFLGTVTLVSKVTLPAVLDKTVSDISKIATPLAIIVLGASFTFSSIKGYVKELVITVLARLVIVPLVMLSVAAALGFKGEALACLMVVFGSPVAVSSFSMAKQMDGDENLAAQVVVVSSAACLVTLFLWIFAINSLSLF